MAMLNVQQNLATAMQNKAELILFDLKGELERLVTMYATEGMANLTDADYAMYAETAHVTVAEMVAAKNALSEVSTAIGQYVAGAVATRLIKIVRKAHK